MKKPNELKAQTKIHYYPGCTLKEKATNLDDSTRADMEVLGYELVEPEGWTRCGAESSTRW